MFHNFDFWLIFALTVQIRGLETLYEDINHLLLNIQSNQFLKEGLMLLSIWSYVHIWCSVHLNHHLWSPRCLWNISFEVDATKDVPEEFSSDFSQLWLHFSHFELADVSILSPWWFIINNNKVYDQVQSTGDSLQNSVVIYSIVSRLKMLATDPSEIWQTFCCLSPHESQLKTSHLMILIHFSCYICVCSAEGWVSAACFLGRTTKTWHL